jgi:hypothetical protein
LKEFKAKGVDVVAVVAFNDPYVMSAWGKANGVKGDDIVCSRSTLRQAIACWLPYFLQLPRATLWISLAWNLPPDL